MTVREYRIRVKIDSKDAERGAKQTSSALKGVERASKNAGLAVAALAAAAAVATAALARSFISAASEAEQYNVRLKVLLRSSEEGARAFDEMREFASRVPFEFREIMSSATTLAAVLRGGVDEISGFMPIIGDLAAAFGLTIEETTGQVVRMLSAGAAAADMFRERGVLNMLGFQDGVQYSAEQTRKILIDSWADVNSQFRGATDELAKTWKGTMSQLSDAWFLFRTTVMEQGLQEELTGIANQLVELARDPSVQQFAVDVGTAMSSAVQAVTAFLSAWTDVKAAIFQGTADLLTSFKGFSVGISGTWDHARSVTLAFAASVQESLRNLTERIGEMMVTWQRRIASSLEVMGRYGPAGFRGPSAAAATALEASAAALETAMNANRAKVDEWIAHLKQASAEAMQQSLVPDTSSIDLWIEALEDAAQQALLAGRDSAEAATKVQTLQEILDKLRNAATGAAGTAGAGGGVKELRKQISLLRSEMRRLEEINQLVLNSFEEVSGITAPTGVVGDATPFEVPEFELPDLDISEELEAELSAGYAAFVKAAETAELNAFIAENLTRGIQGALASGLSEFFQTGKLEFEDFFNTVADLAANILGQALAAELTKVMQENMQSGGGIGGMFGGATGTALAIGITASNIQGANDQGYAAAGAALGAAIGAGIGAWFTGGAGAATGAKWGAVIGSWLGSMVKHGAPSFTGALEAEMGALDLKGQLSYMGGTMGQDIAEGAERILSALGGTLESLSADITLEMREGLAVFVNGIRTYFDSEHISEGIQFAIVEALKNADISGISDEARAALENTTADTMEELLSDLDFARWIEQLDLTDSARALDDFVDQFRIAWDRMVKLGIDGAEKLAQWASKSLEDQRRSILGLQETAEERIRREAAGFNAEVQLIRAEQEARRAELMIRREQLAAEVSMLEAHGEIMQQRITIDGEILRGERNLLAGKLAMLEAIDNALAAVDALLEGLPDLISDAEINRAIRNAGRGSGPTEADREAARRASEGFGLSAMAQQLLTATTFVERHMESIAELGFSEEELADIRRRAHEEQQQMIRDLGRSALAGLGTTSVATIQRMQDLGIHLAFLRNNFEELGLTAQQLMQATRELGQEITLSVASGLARYIDDADVRRELQVLEHALFMEQKRIEILAAHTMGLITEEQYQMLLDLLDLASEWEPPDESEIVRPVRIISRSFDDAQRSAERIAESFRSAKANVAEFLNEVLVGSFGGVSPVGGVAEAATQLDEVIRQAMTGNIGAIESFDEYAARLLRQAEAAYGSSPEFQAIRDYVLAAGRDILGLRQGREGNLIFDERFYDGQREQINQTQRVVDLLDRIDRHLRSQRPIAGAGVN